MAKLAEYNPLALKATQETKDLRVTHVYKEGKHFYLMVNEGNKPLYFYASTAVKGHMELWNPWDGSIVPVCSDAQIPFKLGYRESLILAVAPFEEVEIACGYGELVRVEALSSETRRYIVEVNVDAEECYTYAEIAHSGEIVTLYVDDVQVCTRMWAPYGFELSDLLKEGTNTITLEVTDSMGKTTAQDVPMLKLYK